MIDRYREPSPIHWSLAALCAVLVGTVGIAVSMVDEASGFTVAFLVGTAGMGAALRSRGLGPSRSAAIGMLAGLTFWSAVVPAF